MSYGHLTVVCGPMYAGKTTELLKRILWAKNGQGRKVAVLKPAFDTRYSTTQVKSHDGLAADAISFTDWSDERIVNEVADADVVCLDEVQFMIEPYISGDTPAFIRRVLSLGKDVVANGLDLDWRGEPFPITAALMAMADEVIKQSANCTICGRPATKTFKKVPDEEQVALGAGDLYEARCNIHWNV